jgi:hypothetical protein
MKDNNLKEVKVGNFVKHRFRNYPKGKIERILDGCNAVCWVDFGETVSGKKHLTICGQFDIISL